MVLEGGGGGRGGGGGGDTVNAKCLRRLNIVRLQIFQGFTKNCNYYVLLKPRPHHKPLLSEPCGIVEMGFSKPSDHLSAEQMGLLRSAMKRALDKDTDCVWLNEQRLSQQKSAKVGKYKTEW